MVHIMTRHLYCRVAAITNWPLLLEVIYSFLFLAHLIIFSPFQEKLATNRRTFAELASCPRDVLMMLKQKPKSINFYEPKFDMM